MHWKMVNSHGYVTKGYARFHNSLFCRIVIVCVSITRYDSYLWFLWKWSTFLVDFTYLSLFVLFCFVLFCFLFLSLSVSLFPNLIGVDLFLGLPHSTYGWLTHDQCWRRCILFGWTIWRNNNDTEQNINLHTMFFICANPMFFLSTPPTIGSRKSPPSLPSQTWSKFLGFVQCSPRPPKKDSRFRNCRVDAIVGLINDIPIPSSFMICHAKSPSLIAKSSTFMDKCPWWTLNLPASNEEKALSNSKPQAGQAVQAGLLQNEGSKLHVSMTEEEGCLVGTSQGLRVDAAQ